MARAAGGVVLGGVLILHGLGVAVLILRGVDAAGPGVWSAPLTVAALAGVVGFVAAGLAVLGVRPLAPLLLPLPLLAALCALAAQARLPDGDLWPGALLNLALPLLTTLWWATRRRAGTGRTRSWRGLAGDAAGLAFLGWVVVSAALWPFHRTWGTGPADWAAPLPGDRAPRQPASEILHGVTIAAPPAAVWPWLMQIGQDRGGFYSYDWLERLFGVDVRNVTELRREWPPRRAGDVVYATQPGYLGGLFGERPGWAVSAVAPDRAIVLQYWGAFVLQPDGAGGTRFLIRSTISDRRIPVWAAALNFSAFELPHFIMQRRMMLGIKALAEQTPPGRVR